jgi:type 2A phosphatase activator TIP41
VLRICQQLDATPCMHHACNNNGSCVQLRMMPKCWFVLLRFWLRVDDSLVRLREARYFCATEQPGEVLREVKHSEGTFAELRAAGAPANNVRCRDAGVLPQRHCA